MSVPSSEATAGAQQRSFWIPVICGAVILTIGIGARQSFGIFQKPIAADLNVGRELWSFANALAMLLMGAFSPFAGNVADRLVNSPSCRSRRCCSIGSTTGIRPCSSSARCR